MKQLSFVLCLFLTSQFAFAQDVENSSPINSQQKSKKIIILGQTPLTSNHQIIGESQYFDSEQLKKTQALSVADFMKNQLVSLNISDVQNNPFQPDVQYRGFTASPLLGLPQGVSVYLNGSRFNEPFGDTVNWDLIPLAAIDTVALYSGSNPTFGQNTLGGALSINTKNGFSYTQTELDLRAGSFGQQQYTLQSGNNQGQWAYYIVANGYQEDGWRDHSKSELKQILATVSYESDRHWFDITAATNNNRMRGNGAVPEELATLAGREAVYTQPDETHNQYQQFSFKSNHYVNKQLSWQANAYSRDNEINSLNGDDSDYTPCLFGTGVTLCEGDDDDDENESETEENEEEETLEAVHFVGYDENTALSDISSIDPETIDGTLNTSTTENKSYGATFQLISKNQFASFENELTLGVGADVADIKFRSDTQFAILHNETINDDRSVSGIGLFDTESLVRLNVEIKQNYIYFVDVISFNDHLTLNLSGRYNHSEVSMIDQIDSGEGSLNGEHQFHRFNPAASLNYKINNQFSFKLSYNESSRAPSPAELSCADEDDPCKLPNAFVADPPLKQVVAKTFESSLRYDSNLFSASTTLYSTNSYDDIIFQQAGERSNEGFFVNIEKTRRQGVELAISTQTENIDFGASYNYLDATFESPFVSFSPVNPLGADRQVSPGDQIPGQPNNQFKFHADWQINHQMSLGTEFISASSSFYRGDEANENKQIPSYQVTNLYWNYQITEQFRLSTKIDNLFDKAYNTFGTYGEADEVLEAIYPDAEFEEYFVGPARPRAFSVSLNYRF